MVEEGPKEPVVKQLRKPVLVPALEVHNPVAEQPGAEEFISHPL